MNILAKLFGLKVDGTMRNDSDNPISNKAVCDALALKQDKLVSGRNVKTINGQSILGGGDITINTASYDDSKLQEEVKNLRDIVKNTSSLPVLPKLKTINGQSITGEGNIEIRMPETVAAPAPSVTVGEEQTARYHLPKNNGRLVQAMLDVILPGKCIVIGHDYVAEEDILFPKDSMVYFEGGSISGGKKINGNGSSINEDVAYNIFGDCEPVGFRLTCLDLRWIGGVPDYNEVTKSGTDNRPYFERALAIIGRYYSGLHIRLVGGYFIGSGFTTPYDVNIIGYHLPVRDGESNRDLTSGNAQVSVSSPSLIAVKDGVTAFTMDGRAPKGKDWHIGFIWLKNLKVIGTGTKAVFIEYRAHGCPTRISGIEECEFTRLGAALFFNCLNGDNPNDTQLGNLTIARCLAYECQQFIVARGAKLTDRWVGNTVNNLKIVDCNIEQNGAYAIDIGYRDGSGIHGVAFGNVVIDNNNLEGQESPIRVLTGYGNITVSNNYFEATWGNYVMDLGCTNSNSRAVVMNNYYAVGNKRIRLSNFGGTHVFDNANVQ